MKPIKSVFVTLFGVLLIPGLLATATAQESVYFKHFVKHSDGSACEHLPPNATFTAYLNQDLSKVLVENTPRWDSNEGNITGNGTFGVELGNFADPAVQGGDSIFVQFTDNTTGERGIVTDSVPEYPYTPNPQFLFLEQADFPAAPQNVQLTVNEQNERTITWDTESGMTYDVYRREVQDLVQSDKSRMLYMQIATDVGTGAFTDTTTADTVMFGYMVYAENSSGVRSSHSPDVVESDAVPNFRVTGSTPTTITLDWDAYESPVGETKGYNIYRRTADGTYGDPIGYARLDSPYVDSRLEPSMDYFYKISGRIDPYNEYGLSEEISGTTLPAQDGYYQYTNLKIAVIIYKHTNYVNGGDYQMTDQEVADLKALLEYLREYKWRNTLMKVNYDFEYIVVEEYKDFGDAGSGESTRITGDHLEQDYGVVNTQYDMVYRLTPATGGNWSFGATDLLGLPGPDRLTGFSQHIYHGDTNSDFEKYAKWDPDITLTFDHIWTFAHESQHALDGIYRHNGHLEMGHGDFPELYGNPDLIIGTDPGYPGTASEYPDNYPEGWGYRFAKRFDYQSTLLRDFAKNSDYLDLYDDWAEIYEVVDADNDGFPDHDPNVPFDEARFGSSTSSADTDGDGLTDREEATDGIYDYSYADPNKQDTDGDGKIDGRDSYPRYPVNLLIKDISDTTKPVIDGDLSDWPVSALVMDTVYYATHNESFSPRLYMAYDADSLYIAMNLKNAGIPLFRFDFDADGWWYGAGNTEVKISPSVSTFLEFRSWDARHDVQTYQEEEEDKKSGSGMWDNASVYQNEFMRRVIAPQSVNLVVNLQFPKIKTELAIPRTEAAGLTLEKGSQFGFMLNYDKVNNQPGHEATSFDQWSFVYVTLGDSVSTNTAPDSHLPRKFTLDQNYPNPFNAQTLISYTLPEKSMVDLSVYNIRGQRVANLVRQVQDAGRHQLNWDGTDESGQVLPSGVYFYRVTTAAGKSMTKKMILLQ